MKLPAHYTLTELAAELDGSPVSTVDSPILGPVTDSSAEVTTGSIFVAVQGTHRDGHDFVSEAFEKGAVLAVVQQAEALEHRPGIVLDDTRKAIARLAALCCGNPSQSMTMIGITGTNGKTTINWMIYHALEACGLTACRIGTLGVACSSGYKDESSLTTPSAQDIQRILRRALDQGATHCVMEVSSHALHQSRVEGILFSSAVFTNISRDHLDYHPTIDDYFESKAALFTMLKNSAVSVVNCDDSYGQKLFARLHDSGRDCLSLGFDSSCSMQLQNFSQTRDGLTVDLRSGEASYSLKSQLIGEYNSYNLASSFAVLVSLGIEPEQAAASLLRIPQVPGRLERVPADDIGIFVDYAHTPDALENVLNALKNVPHNKLWVVFGCGGDRDRGKRPMMGQIASSLADTLIVTSDNPRSEEPQLILEEICAGCSGQYMVEVDRRKAIFMAITEASPDDIVLIAGKGHEDYQILKTETIHFSDVEEAMAAVEIREKAGSRTE